MADERVQHLQDLLARLEAARARLESVDDAADAVPILGELGDLAREVAAEVDRQRRDAADAAEGGDQLELG